MEDTVIEQAQVTSPEVDDGETKVETPATEPQVETKANEPYRTFATQADFDRHSAGILNSAKNKAEKELLAMLGLKPDEKDKLAKFKDAYDATLSESEKQAKTLEDLNGQVISLTNQLNEANAIISALSKLTGKNSSDVDTYVKMAKGLVDENTSMDVALEKVLSLAKTQDAKPSVPSSLPLQESNQTKVEENPFQSDNLTAQGKLIASDREKARAMYMAVHGRAPSW